MIRYIWAGMIVAGIAAGALTGRMDEIGSAVMESAQSSAALALSLIGTYALWLGLLRIAQDSGMIDAVAKRAHRAVSMLFGGLKKGSEAVGLITMNLVANMLGMGNAATPFGLKAMAALQSENPQKDRASDDMCTFIILNTASVQLLPLSVIAVRAAAGSADPAEIVPTALAATLATAVLGVALGKACAGLGRKKTGGRSH